MTVGASASLDPGTGSSAPVSDGGDDAAGRAAAMAAADQALDPAPQQQDGDAGDPGTPAADQQGNSEDAWFAQLEAKQNQQGGDTAGTAAKPAAASPQPPAQQQQQQAAPITDDQREVIRRAFKKEDWPEAEQALQALPENLRTKFVKNASDKNRFIDHLQGQLKNALKGQQPADDAQQADPSDPDNLEDADDVDQQPAAGQQAPAQQRQQQRQAATPPPPELDAAWKGVADIYDETGAAPIRQAVEATIGAQLAPHVEELQGLTGYVRDIFERVMEDDFQHALEAWQAPEGVDKSNPDVQAKLRAEIQQLLPTFNLRSNNLRHLLPRAASLAFSTQTQQAARSARTQAQQRALRGSPDPGTQLPGTRPVLTEAQREDLYLEGRQLGYDGDRLKRYVAQGGRL